MCWTRPKKKLLLIEDDSRIAHLMASRLNPCIYQITCLTLANQTLNFLRNNAHKEEPEVFDLILLGLSLTVTEKRQILSSVRGSGDGTPIIIISANYEPDEPQIYQQMGANDYLNRPFTLSELVSRCQAWLTA